MYIWKTRVSWRISFLKKKNARIQFIFLTKPKPNSTRFMSTPRLFAFTPPESICARQSVGRRWAGPKGGGQIRHYNDCLWRGSLQTGQPPSRLSNSVAQWFHWEKGAPGADAGKCKGRCPAGELAGAPRQSIWRAYSFSIRYTLGNIHEAVRLEWFLLEWRLLEISLIVSMRYSHNLIGTINNNVYSVCRFSKFS